MNMGFWIWMVCGILFFLIGISCFISKKQVGFWANAETPKMRDVKAYNFAVGKLWIAYAVVFCLLGIPLYLEDDRAILLSVPGVFFESIALMAIYMKIETKYKK